MPSERRWPRSWPRLWEWTVTSATCWSCVSVRRLRCRSSCDRPRRSCGRARGIEAIGLLQTLPGVGPLTATTIYAWVGDVRRFPNAKALAAYAGLVPSVRQSGDEQRLGSMTKTGSKALRSTLVQAANVLLYRCQGTEVRPLQEIGARVHTSRGRRKIATVALARHLLLIAYYILRDRSVCDPKRLRLEGDDAQHAA